MNGISNPASAGPAIAATAVPPSMRLFAWDIRRSSSPTSSGRITRWDAKYGGMNAPSTATIPSRSGNDSTPAAWRTGTDASNGARARSEASIVVREPSRWTSAPLGTPRSAIGTISAARTSVIFDTEPVVTSTNHGNAR